ncbi:hypothetical protein BU15DRAFT_79449 [Melanogaster broomeanus]|nr:hypothetical protein BU15DRAFT_79449 [Melanogaster broomeanus]
MTHESILPEDVFGGRSDATAHSQPRRAGCQVFAPMYAMRSVDDVEKDISDGRIAALRLPLSLKHSVYYNQDRKAYKPHIYDPQRIFRHAQSRPTLFKNDDEPHT